MAKKVVNFRLDEEKKRDLDVYLAKRGMKLQQFIEEYIDRVLAEEKEEKQS